MKRQKAFTLIELLAPRGLRVILNGALLIKGQLVRRDWLA